MPLPHITYTLAVAVDGNNDRVQLDAQWLINTKLSYQLSSNSQCFLQIKNIADTSYRTPPASGVVLEGTPNREREILIGVTYQF